MTFLKSLFLFAVLFLGMVLKTFATEEWIRINQLGYTPKGIKVAVWASKTHSAPKNFQLVNAQND